MENNRKYGLWWALAIGLLVILLFYGKFIFSPNSYLFSPGGDGIKNYYTFAWHVKYDSSYTHFSGMNHPYGEHVVFTDNQPLVSNAARFVNSFIKIEDYAAGINNLLLFIGLLAAIGILYKLFFALTGHTWFAVATSVTVGMMSPQIDRFDGHFALAYCFVVPLFIWWCYKFFAAPKWKISLWMGLTLLLLLYVHVYYLVIIGALLLPFWLVFLLLKKNGITLMKAIPHVFIQLILPFAVYFIWLKMTDTVTDRPTQPYGIVEYAAYWEGLLLPLDYDYFQPLKKILGVRKVSVETIAYAGLPVLLFILWSIVSGIYNRFKKKPEQEQETIPNPAYNSRFLFALLTMAILVFAYAAFFPYLFNMPSISKYLGLLKQFRSLGRLLWVVFYGVNIVLFVKIYIASKEKQKFKWLPWVMIGILAVEGVLYNIHTRNIIDNPRQQLSWVPKTITADKYEAIIPIPFFHEGSENIGFTPSSDTIVGQSFLLSWQTGIPLQAVKMSRTSLNQTLKQLEFAYEITQVPALMKNSTKPYLILHYIKDTTSLPNYWELQPIAQTDSFKLYEITPAKLGELINHKAFITLTDSLMNSIKPVPLLFKNTYETQQTNIAFKSKGAWMIDATQTTKLIDTMWRYNYDSLSVSFWMYAKTEGLPQLKLLVSEKDDLKRVHVLDHVKTIVDDWMFIKYNFRPYSEKNHIRLLKEGAKPGEAIYLDNLMIEQVIK